MYTTPNAINFVIHLPIHNGTRKKCVFFCCPLNNGPFCWLFGIISLGAISKWQMERRNIGAGTAERKILCERIVVFGKKDLVGQWGLSVSLFENFPSSCPSLISPAFQYSLLFYPFPTFPLLNNSSSLYSAPYMRSNILFHFPSTALQESNAKGLSRPAYSFYQPYPSSVHQGLE